MEKTARGRYIRVMTVAPIFRRILMATAGLAVLAAAPRAVAGVGAGAALMDAQAVVANRPGFSVVQVSGNSMVPYFRNGAVIVMKQIDPARLRVGMIAVYVNRFGERVVHRVIARVDGGWQVKGYNNARPDSTVVNAGNLLGIVYATFDIAAREMPVNVAAVDLPRVETVYAAPAE
jgi:signal peptidase I